MGKEKLMMFSTMLEREDIVNELRKECEKALALGKNADSKSLGIWCMVYLMNESTNGDFKKMQELLTKWEETERMSDLLTKAPTASA